MKDANDNGDLHIQISAVKMGLELLSVLKLMVDRFFKMFEFRGINFASPPTSKSV